MLPPYFLKQVIVVRKDLNMRKGKMSAQVAHASMKFLVDVLTEMEPKDQDVRNLLTEDECTWLFSKSFAKIVVSVDTEQELLDLMKEAEQQGIKCKEIVDSGRTEFHGLPTLTCAAFGPDRREKLDKLTGHLKLL